MDGDPRSHLVRVHGDEQAKETNPQPAYTRTSRERQVRFTCRRCGEEVIEWRFPGPLPWYCPSCRDQRIQERETERVKRQRERRQMGRVRHRPPDRSKRGPDRPPQTATTVAPAVPDAWADFLPATITVLAQIREQTGERLAAEMAFALKAELDHLRATVGREQQEALIQLFSLGDQVAYAGLVDVGVDAGRENWSTYANSANLDQLRAAIQNARRLARAAERRRKFAQRGSKDQQQSQQEEKKKIQVELYLRVEGNSKFVRGKSTARKHIEDWVLRRYAMKKQPTGDEYHLTIPYDTDAELDSIICNEILGEAASIADGYSCFTEGNVRALDKSERYW
jgi:hypothetical protein